MSIKSMKLAARALGQMYFDSGAPCKEGHISKRYASTGQCVECMTAKSSKPLSDDQVGFGMSTHKLPRLLLVAELAPSDADALDDYVIVCCIQFLEHKGLNPAALKTRLQKARALGQPVREHL